MAQKETNTDGDRYFIHQPQGRRRQDDHYGGRGQMLASEFKKRVLLIDLDPQTNATAILIGDDKWRSLNDEGQTIAQLFRDALNGEKKVFDISKAIQKNVGNVDDVKHLDLLPSSLDLIDVQDDLSSMNRGRFHASSPIES